MPKQGDAVITELAVLATTPDPSGARIEAKVHNLTDAEIPEDALTIALSAQARSGQTQSEASVSFYVGAIPAGEVGSPDGPLQLDPGDWAVEAHLFDAATNQYLDAHGPIDVHIPGYVHQAQAFDNATEYDVSVQIERIEHLAPVLYRVHYLLANNGTTTVPPGMLVRAMIVENDDNISWQDYHFELSCPPGPPDPKYLSLEGNSTFTDAAVYVTVDPGGPSEATDAVRATVAEDGKVEIFR